jgi:Cu(I)/Ag(I) efflux system membrane fusion protein
MKMKTMLMIALAATLGGSAVWVATDRAVAADNTSVSRKILYYTCPMHPSVKADKPGNCPICGMNLVPVYDTKGGTNNPPAVVNTNQPSSMPGCCSPDGGGCK